MTRTIDLERMNKPISESSPSGQNLYQTVHRQIEEARTASVDANRRPRDPDWKKVLQLGTEALEKRTKDLQIAAYVTEALGWLEGLDGLRQGFELLRAIQEQFWTSVYPLYDEEHNLGERLSPYDFIEEVVPRVLHVSIPLTAAPLMASVNLQQFNPTNQTAEEREARDDAIRRSEPLFHQQLSDDLNACRSAFDEWQASNRRLMAENAPLLEHTTASLRKLDSCLRTIEAVRPFARPPAVPTPAGTPPEVDPMAHNTTLGSPSSTLLAGDASGNIGGPSDLLAAGSPAGLGGNGRPIAALAAELANSGRLESAIELLDGARQSARCRRDRFIRQLELVELCLERGLTHVARPLIDELAGEQETRNLEDWEDPELCARVLMASVACLRASSADHDGQRIPGILERLYRLDPRRALRRDMMP